ITIIMLSFFLSLNAAKYIDQHLYFDIFIGEAQYLQLKSESYFYLNSPSDSTYITFPEVLQINYDGNESQPSVWVNGNFYNLPITIASDKPIEFNGYKYNGMFLLTATKENKIKLINNVEMEDYIAGVIPYEIGVEAPYEALKAQAVAARSHTVKQLLNSKHSNDGYDLCNTTHCQVYNGLTRQTERTYRAAIETTNEILIFENEVVDAVYHSCCGGSTEDAKDLWGSSRNYLIHTKDSRNNESIYCSLGGKYINWYKSAFQWSSKVSKNDIKNKLSIGNIQNIQIQKRGKSGRILTIKVNGSLASKTIKNELEIRKLFNNAKSSNFVLQDKGSYYLLNGYGTGHGVGMCQIGAIVQAYLGFSYEDILLFYYNGTKISDEWLLNNFKIK
ncbi:MAG: SpoIID/LytB domain-containing protein, partial [Candidatus Cloacimonetes bacterium]|nr:SpoIID/LytB domain-containing protein [Candidatus Cloacimonadota bacterium]